MFATMMTEHASAGSVAIREWSSADLETIRRITWETWEATYTSFIPASDLKTYFDQQYTLEALQSLCRREQFRGYLAVVDGEPAGYAKANYFPSEGRLYVQSLYILPRFQGRGVGRALLARAEEQAREYGLDRIWLGVMTQNSDALWWYKRHGFEFVEKAPFTMGETTVEHMIGYRRIKS